jgi:hypothetical protein
MAVISFSTKIMQLGWIDPHDKKDQRRADKACLQCFDK